MKFLKTDPEGLLRFLTSNLVQENKKIKITSFYKGKNYISLEAVIGKDQIGRVIGKNGKIINAINTIVNASIPKKYWDETDKDYKYFKNFSIDIQE